MNKKVVNLFNEPINASEICEIIRLRVMFGNVNNYFCYCNKITILTLFSMQYSFLKLSARIHVILLFLETAIVSLLRFF